MSAPAVAWRERQTPGRYGTRFEDAGAINWGGLPTTDSLTSRVVQAMGVFARTVAMSSPPELEVPQATNSIERHPDWYEQLEDRVEAEATYPVDSEYPSADPAAQQAALEVTRAIYDAFGLGTPEPYFDAAPDLGVDVYFDHGANELLVHVPPPGSTNYYCFSRLDGVRTVRRNPSQEELLEILESVVGTDGLQ